jgi:hypothetical protein
MVRIDYYKHKDCAIRSRTYTNTNTDTCVVIEGFFTRKSNMRLLIVAFYPPNKFSCVIVAFDLIIDRSAVYRKEIAGKIEALYRRLAIHVV